MSTHDDEKTTCSENVSRRAFIGKVSRVAVGLSLLPSVRLSDGKSFLGPWPGRVVRVVDSKATSGSTIDGDVVQTMMDEAIKTFTGKTDVAEGWATLFPSIRLSTDVVSIKVNCINPHLYSHLEVVDAIVDGLKRMGVAENNIIIWDRGNNDLMRCGYTINETGSGVRCFGTGRSGIADYDSQGVSVHDETVFLSRIVTTYSNYVINVSCLKAHGGYNGAGVTLCLKNHYGSLSLNADSYASPETGRLHNHNCNPYIPALNARPTIRDKQVLCVCDALFGNHLTNQAAPTFVYNGLILGADPVAVDYTGMQVLRDNGCTTTGMATHIATAARSPYDLGTNDPARIALIDLVNPSSRGSDSSGSDDGDAPAGYRFDQNYPNPFNPRTNICFSVPREEQVTLEVFNARGELIRTLVNRRMTSGEHVIPWDGADQRGRSVSSGSYFCRLTAGSFVGTQRMLKIK